MMSEDERRLGWSAQRWADEIGYSKTQVIVSKAWKWIMRLRAHEQLGSRRRGLGATTPPALDDLE